MHPISLARGLPPGFEWTSLHPLREPGLARARGVARVQAKTCWLQVSWVCYYCSNPKKDRHINPTKTVIHYFSIFLGVAICLFIARYSANRVFLMVLIQKDFQNCIVSYMLILNISNLVAPYWCPILDRHCWTLHLISSCQPMASIRQCGERCPAQQIKMAGGSFNRSLAKRLAGDEWLISSIVDEPWSSTT